MAESPPIVIAFAASDPSGGAGLQSDLLTISSMGCHALTVVTAITVQDTARLEALYPLDADWVADQARSLLEDMPVQAFKIGLLGSVEAAAAVAEIIADYPDVPVVLDPVLMAGEGGEAADEDLVAVIRELLVPQATVVVAGAGDARLLVQDDGDDTDNPDGGQCATRLLALGAEYVLLTGAHENTPQMINTLYSEEGILRTDAWQRIPGSYHGAGAILSAALAAGLASGLPMGEAVREAQEFAWQALAAGFRPGMGRLLADPLFWGREPDETEAG